MVTIGILGSKDKSEVAEILETILKKNNKDVCVIGTSQDSSSEFFKLLYDSVEYCIIELSREDILQESLDKIKFDIIIQTTLEEESENVINAIQKLITRIREKGYVIFNSDSIQKISFECDCIYPVTYGLNGKTTVTASSIDDIEGLCFSYCLQRAIFTIYDNLCQPFEEPVRVKGKTKDVYHYLAAYTCIIILGYSFKKI